MEGGNTGPFWSVLMLAGCGLVTFGVGNEALKLISTASTLSVIVGIILLAAVVGATLALWPTYQGLAKKLLTFLSLMLVVGATSGCGWKTIPPGYVGIVVNQYGSQKGVEDFPAQVGRIHYNPWTEAVYLFPTFQQNVVWTNNADEGSPNDDSITFNGSEGTAINVDVALGYSLVPDKVPYLFMHYKQDIDHITHTYLRSEFRDLLNRDGAQYTTMEILGAKKQVLLDQIKKGLEDRLGDKGFRFDMVSFIGKPRIDPKIEEAISASIAATQQAQAAQNKVAQIKAEAEQNVAYANGKAAAILAEAKAQAQANHTLAASVTPELTAYMYAQKWDGHMPQVTSGVTPFLSLPNGK